MREREKDGVVKGSMDGKDSVEGSIDEIRGGERDAEEKKKGEETIGGEWIEIEMENIMEREGSWKALEEVDDKKTRIGRKERENDGLPLRRGGGGRIWHREVELVDGLGGGKGCEGEVVENEGEGRRGATGKKLMEMKRIGIEGKGL
ncbi:hypothetical protein COCNU_14G000950 [Cocos nucifera]|uniref:Uncharacterized protein n=1 Tax=Cocos nucifera TaxID=13894 RepID=A0A8K0ITS6_COCNU|nr:hypothetical protein COCNU_14G000950 [Cocos nucifera]